MGYDAADQRVSKRDDLGMTYFLGQYLERDPAGHFVKHYWADDRVVASRDGNGDLTDVHPDHLGSTRLLTDRAGHVRERFDYDPYGKLLAGSRAKTDERRFQGQRLDHDSGLIHMGARSYDPELATFISPDSIIPDPYRPQSLDRYAYVEHDPVNHIDPSGHSKIQVEMRKAQAGESSFGWMYARALSGDCSYMPSCSAALAPVGAPGTEVCLSCPSNPKYAKVFARDAAKATARLQETRVAGDTATATPIAQDVGAPVNRPAAGPADDSQWRYPEDGSADAGLTTDQMIAKYGLEDSSTQCEAACELAKAMFDPNVGPRATTELDMLAGGMLAVPAAVMTAGVGALALGAEATLAGLGPLLRSGVGNLVLRATPFGTALSKSDAGHRAGTFVVDAIKTQGFPFLITGGDGVQRLLVQLPGALNGLAGRYEWIIHDTVWLTHQMFVRGGSINGIPIKP
jgi:RHS repeat-associated protein